MLINIISYLDAVGCLVLQCTPLGWRSHQLAEEYQPIQFNYLFIQSCAMPISSETLKQDLARLTQEQLQQVAEFIAFLKFRAKRDRQVRLEPTQLTVATEFGAEDSALAEAGMSDYAVMLNLEDEL